LNIYDFKKIGLCHLTKGVTGMTTLSPY